MTPEQFCYWLQGYLEVADPEKIDGKQLAMLKEHLQLVFTKVTGQTQVTVQGSGSGLEGLAQGIRGFGGGVTLC